METWREELYHGLLANVKGRLKLNSGAGSTIGKKSVGSVGKSSGTGKGREWTKHKYVRKEGSRYIYPEDLKKRSDNKKANSGNKSSGDKKNKTNTTRDSHQKDWENRRNKYGEKLINKYSKPVADRPYTYRKDVDRTSRVLRIGQLKGAKAKKALNEVQNVLDVYHNWEFPSKSVMLSKTESKKTDGSTEFVTQRTKLKYEKGKQWVDSLTVNQYYDPKMNGNNYFYENEYVYTYGRLSQARMAGQDFVNSILGKKK